VRQTRSLAAGLVLAVAAAGCGGTDPATVEPGTSAVTTTTTVTTTAPITTPVTAERLRLNVAATHPHDTAAFTEGLLFDDHGALYESTGQYGESSIRRVEPDTGAVLETVALDPTLFGEGLAMSADGTLVQLTWKEHRALRWTADGLTPGGTQTYDGEGWGLTDDAAGSRLVMSNGSSTLTFRDPTTFAVTRTVEVTLDAAPVTQLNELEAVDGVIWANVWQTDQIMRIDPTTGRVTGVVDASGLLSATQLAGADVLNGIAHRPGDPADRLWVTGKYWPTMFEVDVVPA